MNQKTAKLLRKEASKHKEDDETIYYRYKYLKKYYKNINHKERRKFKEENK